MTYKYDVIPTPERLVVQKLDIRKDLGMEKTAGGLELPQNLKLSAGTEVGRILARGQGVPDMLGLGNMVVYPEFAGVTVELEQGRELVILGYQSVVAVVEDLSDEPPEGI